MYDLSWLNPTPHAIAVYASRPLSPEATEDHAPLEIRPAEVRLLLSALKVRKDVVILSTPRVPGSHALLEQCDVLVVRHRSIQGALAWGAMRSATAIADATGQRLGVVQKPRGSRRTRSAGFRGFEEPTSPQNAPVGFLG